MMSSIVRSVVAICISIAAGRFAAAQTAQGERPPRPPAREQPAEDDARPLSAEQKRQVKTILSRYVASKLTAEDARAINDAFRGAGLRRSRGLQEAIVEAGFDPRKISALAPPPARAGATEPRPPAAPEKPAAKEPQGRARPAAPGRYSIEQAVSDRAQQNTIAFDALAFLTGNLGSYTFLPPGKVSDFFGFQYMRDVDAGELGHNTSFVPRVANNVLYILTEKQRAQLIALAAEQESPIREFAYRRFPLVKAFRRLLDGDVPPGRSGLDRDAVMQYTGDLFELDGRLSYRRAAVVGDIVAHLDPKQKAYLAKMAFGDSRTWPDRADQIDKRSLSPGRHVAVMTYASELFSWYAGSAEADVYFCPERHATYFGSFYMKDIPAMGKPGYSIGTRLTGDSGEAFLEALTASQRGLITGLVALQREPLRSIVAIRGEISTGLRNFMKGETPDRQRVLSLARKYGELDGAISCQYASRFAELNRTLTSGQRQTLGKLRNLDDYPCKGAYVYSRPIDMPEIANTDFLFGAGSSRASGPSK
jgi:hypothetical protein